MLLSSPTYDKAKFAVQIVIPAASTLYFTLSSIWGLPGTEQVMATLAAIAVFLGAVLGISSKKYDESDEKYDGVLLYRNDPQTEKLVYTLDINTDPEVLQYQDSMLLNVTPESD